MSQPEEPQQGLGVAGFDSLEVLNTCSTQGAEKRYLKYVTYEILSVFLLCF